MSENIKAKPITFEQVLELTIDAGQLMLESGAETYRVEQTMNVIMHKPVSYTHLTLPTTERV